MNTTTPARLFFASCLFVALLTGASAASTKTRTIQTGDNTYTTTTQASTAFNRDVDALKAEAQESATKYCASLGKQIKILSVSGKKPFFGTGYPQAVVVFKALDSNDPELTGAVAAAGSPAAAAPARITQTNDLYNDLLKLDDLRKRGILTDEEFQSEKKKVLARSQ